ncbi:GIP [Symbiodinium sp. KB8]|nr:GIP [Symbiodinium sp. KB8]
MAVAFYWELRWTTLYLNKFLKERLKETMGENRAQDYGFKMIKMDARCKVEGKLKIISGALRRADKIYLESCGFPLPPPPAPVSDEVLETRPMLRATFFPQCVDELCGAGSSPTEDNDETWGEWGIYVEEEADGDMPAGLRKMCDSEGPGSEADLLWRTSQAVLGLSTNATYQEDVAECVDGWVGDEGCMTPRVAKLEPEYTPNIEELIRELVDTDTPLRHTHNVSPQEARHALDDWKGAISKELGVVEKGFRRSTVEEVKKLKQTHKVQELPAKLVYTIKPPSNEPTSAHEVVYAVQPPSVLVKLGLASDSERWILTHGMYGLRQSPRLWSEYRDSTIKEMRFVVEGEEWLLKQGDAEPNLWLLVKASDPSGEPGALVLIYVDDILLCGKMAHLRSVASKLSSTWKTTELEVLSESHGIRFLGCEILTTEAKDRFYLHQQPYIKEILRAHDVSETMRSPIQAPKHLVTFEAELDETKGDEAELKMAQRLCGELLWLAQRTRPDISFTVNAMGALISRAAPRCVAIGQRLLAYLQHTQEYALTIAPTTNDLVTFTDSSYAPEGKRSHSGIVVTWTGAPISWRATRTPYICLSTAESELTAAIEGLKMTMSLSAVLEELVGRELPIQLAIDNQSTIAIAKPNGSTSWRTRHLRVRSAFIREQVQAQKVVIKARYSLQTSSRRPFPVRGWKSS